MYYLYDCLDKRMNNYIAGHTARRKLDHFTIRNIGLRWYGVPKYLFTRHRDKQSNNKMRRWNVQVERGETGREHLSVVWQRREKMDFYKAAWKLRAAWWICYVVSVSLAIRLEMGVVRLKPTGTFAILLEVLIAWYSFVYL
jgi:hypothetical protein